MLDHIVEDEECKLEALLLGASEAGRDDLVAEALDKRTTEVLVSLEEGTHELGGSDLEIELIRVLLLDQSEIVGIKHVILILNLLLCGERVVLRDALKRLVDDVDRLVGNVGSLFSSHQTGAGLIDDILEGLNLSNESVRIQFLLHGGVKVSIVLFGHLVESCSIHVSGLCNLHEAGESGGTSATNAVVGLVASLGHKERAELTDVVVADLRDFVDEDGKHLEGNILLFNLVSHHIHGLFTLAGRCHFLEHISELSEALLACNTHLGVKSRHLKNGRENSGKVRRELRLHKKANALPSTEQIDALGVLLLKLASLDREHSFDNALSDRAEGFKTNGGADDRDSLNSLSAELLVLGLVELSEVGQKEIHGLGKEGHEVLTNFLDNCAEGRHGVLLGHGDSVLDEKAELLAKSLSSG